MPVVYITEEEWQLALARAKALPPTIRIAILDKVFSRDELIREIQNRTRYGEQFVLMQMEYLQYLIKKARGE